MKREQEILEEKMRRTEEEKADATDKLADMGQLWKSVDSELAQLKSVHDDVLAERRNLQRVVGELESEKEAVVSRLRADADENLKEVKSEKEAVVSRLQKECDATVEKLRLEKEAVILRLQKDCDEKEHLLHDKQRAMGELTEKCVSLGELLRKKTGICVFCIPYR